MTFVSKLVLSCSNDFISSSKSVKNFLFLIWALLVSVLSKFSFNCFCSFSNASFSDLVVVCFSSISLIEVSFFLTASSCKRFFSASSIFFFSSASLASLIFLSSSNSTSWTLLSANDCCNSFILDNCFFNSGSFSAASSKEAIVE